MILAVLNLHVAPIKFQLKLTYTLGGEWLDFLHYIGYRNFINYLIKHVLLLILVHVRLLFCLNC